MAPWAPAGARRAWPVGRRWAAGQAGATAAQQCGRGPGRPGVLRWSPLGVEIFRSTSRAVAKSNRTLGRSALSQARVYSHPRKAERLRVDHENRDTHRRVESGSHDPNGYRGCGTGPSRWCPESPVGGPRWDSPQERGRRSDREERSPKNRTVPSWTANPKRV